MVASHEVSIIYFRITFLFNIRNIKNENVDTNIFAGDRDQSHLNSGAIRVMLLCGNDFLESFAIPGLWKADHIDELTKKFGMVNQDAIIFLPLIHLAISKKEWFHMCVS